MFGRKRDIYLIPGRRETHHHTHIEMTDPEIAKSAEFLNEVEQEAGKRVKEAVVHAVPDIDAKVATYRMQHKLYDNEYEQRCAFTVNGRRFDVQISQGVYEIDQHGKEIARALADAIAELIVLQCVPAMSTHLTKERN